MEPTPVCQFNHKSLFAWINETHTIRVIKYSNRTYTWKPKYINRVLHYIVCIVEVLLHSGLRTCVLHAQTYLIYVLCIFGLDIKIKEYHGSSWHC